MTAISDYYKYALLSTAAYVRMGSNLLDGTTFAAQAANPNQSGGRLPLSIARVLFDPQLARPGYLEWTIAHYHAGDTGLGATLFQKGKENVLAIRGEGAPA